MKAVHLALIVVACCGCRPLKVVSQVKDDGTNSGRTDITITATNQGVTLAPATSGVAFTGVSDLALKTQASGRIATPTRPRQYVPLLATSDRLLFAFALTPSEGRVCRPDAGVPLKGRATVTCASLTDQILAVRSACRDLARDAAVATYDESLDYCTCNRRKQPHLAFLDYATELPRFQADCRNTGNATNLKSACTELRDRFCQTCQVSDQSCQCPRGVMLTYAAFVNDLEEFRLECGPLDQTAGATSTAANGKPSSGSIDDVVRAAFDVDCTKIGIVHLSAGVIASCECGNGQSISLEAYRTDAGILTKECQ